MHKRKAINAKALRRVTPELLCHLGLRHHGKGWHAKIAVELKVHRTTVCRWASGATKISPRAEAELLRYFQAKA